MYATTKKRYAQARGRAYARIRAEGDVGFPEDIWQKTEIEKLLIKKAAMYLVEICR